VLSVAVPARKSTAGELLQKSAAIALEIADSGEADKPVKALSTLLRCLTSDFKSRRGISVAHDFIERRGIGIVMTVP